MESEIIANQNKIRGKTESNLMEWKFVCILISLKAIENYSKSKQN